MGQEMDVTDVIQDAEIVEDETTALAVTTEAQPIGLFGTTDPSKVIEKAAKTATALAQVIRDKRLFASISGRDHVLVEGWQLLGSMTGVFAVITHTTQITDDKGNAGWEARCEARTMHGAVIGAADAQCTRGENTWKGRDDYALRSMAQTRAVSKALRGPLGFIVKLAGYSATPAEEMVAEEHDGGPSCPTCNSSVWDNTSDPNRGNRPKWKCKDKSCGWASWDDDPFTSQGSETQTSEPSAAPTSETLHPEPVVAAAPEVVAAGDGGGEVTAPVANDPVLRIRAFVGEGEGQKRRREQVLATANKVLIREGETFHIPPTGLKPTHVTALPTNLVTMIADDLGA